jgi:hypothetical protein
MEETTMRVETNEYEFSHGRKPRGMGCWAFQIGEETVFITGTFTTAKNLAAKNARDKGLGFIKVLP